MPTGNKFQTEYHITPAFYPTKDCPSLGHRIIPALLHLARIGGWEFIIGDWRRGCLFGGMMLPL